jgi:hypothetical protein
MALSTVILVFTIIAFVLWLIGVLTNALPGGLVSACLVMWIVGLVLTVVFGFGFGYIGPIKLR